MLKGGSRFEVVDEPINFAQTVLRGEDTCLGAAQRADQPDIPLN